jgi:oligopeptide/dipeptide ABC transporter ATP-binding protein
MTEAPLLEVTDLCKYFPVRSSGPVRRTVGQVRAVDGVSFEVRAGRSLGLVGESGCGKSTTARLVTRLLDPTSGSIRFDGREIGGLDRRGMRPLRRQIQMVFQDPYSSLNPRQTVGTIVGTPLRVHEVVPERHVPARVRELLELVGLDPADHDRYPSELSGGQRQRVGIARAVALRPRLVVADEPVSALDVSVRAQVVNLLRELQRELGVAFLFIAHDLAVVRHFCPEVAVMYLGKIVEIADRAALYSRPRHPYTQALLSAVPDVSAAVAGGRRDRILLRGDVPSAADPPSGCRFRNRCWKAQEICASEEPPLLPLAPGQRVACHFPGGPGETPTTRSSPRP